MNLVIVIVIVTYNRVEKLKKTLSCYDSQTATFNSIVVVDNYSNDGTTEYLREWLKTERQYKKYVISMEYNSGGSGGFYVGQKFALTLNPDWIYVSDDDAYPELDMIETFGRIVNGLDTSKVSAICTTVYKNDGKIDYDHRRTYTVKRSGKFVQMSSVPDNYLNDCFKIQTLSYVGSFLNSDALRENGLCNPNFFIYYDDSEHSMRLEKFGQILCFSGLKVLHDSGFNAVQADDIIFTWRDYYSLRNYVYMLKKHHFLSAVYVTLQKIWFIIKNHDHKKRLIISALYDAWCGRLGTHKVYKPGYVRRR